ncbi:hypothetical protein OQA88_8305 [Cercophora sp. LCS_1]
MPVCPSCPGRSFGSEEALGQHRVAKHSAQLPMQMLPKLEKPQATPKPRTSLSAARRRENQIQVGLRNEEPIHTIGAADLQPSATPVSSTEPHELICSYNWHGSKGFHAPGHAPFWQGLPLPKTVPKDRNLKGGPPNHLAGWEKTKYPFQQVFQATLQMNPTTRFTNTSIIVTRNSLRKLLDFCSNKSQDSFRINMSLVQNTLLIEQHDSKYMASQNQGWGHSFERTFTRFPAGLESSTAHDRFLRYKIGHLECVVGFEVDACYHAPNNTNLDDAIDLENLSLGETMGKGTGKGPMKQKVSTEKGVMGKGADMEVMPQSTCAELKSTARKSKPLNAILPQLWFGRTPWLIIGSHTDGTFDKITVTDAAAHFKQWETERQVELGKLAAVLSELRDAVRMNNGEGCAAVYEKGSYARVIKVYAVEKGRVVPGEIARRFW